MKSLFVNKDEFKLAFQDWKLAMPCGNCVQSNIFSSIFIFQKSGEFSLKNHSLPKKFSKTNLQNSRNALPKKSSVQPLCHINLISFISCLILNDQPLVIYLLHSYCKHYCVQSYFPISIIVGVSPTCEPCYE
jgi:hypothetical protein